MWRVRLCRSGDSYSHFSNQFVDQEQFHLWLDSDLLVDLIKTDIAYLRGNWKKLGRPTITLPIMRLMLGDPKEWNKNAVWRLIERMSNGYVVGWCGWCGGCGGCGGMAGVVGVVLVWWMWWVW